MNKINLNKLHVAFQMNNINNINIKSDSTFPLIVEAYNRGFTVYYYNPSNLTLLNNKVMAVAQKILNVNEDSTKNYVTLDKEEILELKNINLIWLRQDPPFDIAYLTSTYILDYLANNHNVLILNNSKEVRNYPEKLAAHYFSKYMPQTLITRNKFFIIKFLEKYKKVILKPLYDARGNNIYLLEHNHPNTNSLIELFLFTYKEPIIAQQFLPNVVKGDKRVLMIDGKPLGVFKRIPQTGIISNLAKGGRAQKTHLTPKEELICHEVGKFLKQHNLIFAGIDIIDEYLTEINVTSPTGLKNYYEFTGINLAQTIWDKVLEKILI